MRTFSSKILAPKIYKAEMKLQSQMFQLCHFWSQNISKTSAGKKLMKLTPVVNFTNILQLAFLPIFFRLKITNTNCK